ncbi:MAG: hypothetical protein ACYSWU_24830 [Planctomycetota bacterium]
MWRAHDFLPEKRAETDYKYDYRYSVLTLVFARLMKEGQLRIEDLKGLEEDKIARIRELAKM